MAKFRVVVTECDFNRPYSIEESELRPIGAELVLAEAKSQAEVIAASAEADGLLVQYATINAEVIAQLKRCRVLARYGIGMDMIDLAAAARHGIVCCNVPDYCVSEVADHTMAVLLDLARQITRLHGSVQTGVWNVRHVAAACERVDGQTLGLVGLGKTAQAVAIRARAFGLHVIAYSPRAPDDVFRAHGIQRTGLDELLAAADFVSLHTPLRAETRHLIGARELARMKPSAYLINTARGALVDSVALVHALQAGRLAGAGLDVLEQEPLPARSPLRELPNVLVTPHAAFFSRTSIAILRRETAAEVARVLSGRPPRSPVLPA